MNMRVAVALSALVCLSVVSPLSGASSIFPSPIHITREVQDPISGKTVVLNEYGYGNRLVSVRGDVTAIADYEKGELTEVDRSAGTYSVTRFDTIARVASLQGPQSGDIGLAQSDVRRELKALAAKPTRSGRPADFFRAEGEAINLEIAIDRSIRVSKEALEILLGAAYPGTRTQQHDLVIAAAGNGSGGGRTIAANAAQQQADYALPIEQTFEIDAGNERVAFRSSVLRVASEPPPADVLAIPAGARLVVSKTAAVLRELEQLDGQPLRPSAKP